ncbi:MAG: hypothetical protein WCR67_04230 [Bacilli bacterium]
MINILKSFCFRLKKSALFYVLIVFLFLMSLFTVFNLSQLYGYSSTVDRQNYYISSVVGTFLGGSGSLTGMSVFSSSPIGPYSIFGILVIGFIVNFFEEEWGYRTMRLPIFSGINRRTIYLSSLIFSICIYFFFFLVYAVFYFLMGAIFQNNTFPFFGSLIYKDTFITGTQIFSSIIFPILSMLGWISFTLMILFIVRSRKLPSLIVFGALFVSFIIPFILMLSVGTRPTYGDSFNYYPLLEYTSFYQNTKFSYTMDIASALTRVYSSGDDYSYSFFSTVEVTGRTLPVIIKSLVLSLGSLAGFTLLGIHFFKKGDLK